MLPILGSIELGRIDSLLGWKAEAHAYDLEEVIDVRFF